MKTPHIVTFTGPSLSGKTEISKILKNEYHFNIVTSVTTRPQRGQEIDGLDYYFINEEKYNKLKLIQKTHFNGFNYGVSENEIYMKKDMPLLWVIAPHSISQIEDYCYQNHFHLTKVFITNPEEILYQRLFTRFKEDPLANIETYSKRLQAMVNIEKEWVKESQENPDKYDIIINEFNNSNTKEIIDLIANTILSNHKKDHFNKKEILLKQSFKK